MKLMRSRIRLITFLMICTLLAMLLWGVRSFLSSVSDQENSLSPAISVSSDIPFTSEPVSSAPLSTQAASPSPDFPTPDESPPAEDTLYDTFGL